MVNDNEPGWFFIVNLGKFRRHTRVDGEERPLKVNTLRPGQNGRHFADDIFKCVFLNVNVWTPIKISLKFVPKGPIDDIPSSVQIMAWRRPGDKPLSEPMMVRLPTHICVTRPHPNVKACEYRITDFTMSLNVKMINHGVNLNTSL